MLGQLWTLGYTIVMVGLSIYGLHRLWMVCAYLRWKDHPAIRPKDPAVWPKVTVQLPIFNELYVAERLIERVVELDYPRDLLEVQVLDDSTDETVELVERLVRRWRAEGIDIVHIRRGKRTGFKAGALQAGLEVAKGEFIAVFDADFLPPPDLLRMTLPYFQDAEVGMIQTRWGHVNRDFNLLTRVQALFLDGHLLIEQTARNRSGRFFNFNGTAGVWRTCCIRDAGGWEHDTLTEDLDLSYRAQLAGWRFVFLPDVLTPAELPVDIHAFKAQQHRWAKGAIQTCKKLLPRLLASDLPWKVKVEGVFHLSSNFAYLLLAALAFLTQPVVPDREAWWHVFMSPEMAVFACATLSIILFYVLVLREIGSQWWEYFFFIPALIAVGIGMSINNARAVLEALFGHRSDFARTPKYGITETLDWWKVKKYASWGGGMPWIEMGLCAYYCFILIYAVRQALWTSIPFLLLFLAGFGYITFVTMWQRPIFNWLAIRREEGVHGV
jgi:cellulose synthase/poly-beta-1,6-N-acetylglucosamine synthase-like glycosyltransferase